MRALAHGAGVALDDVPDRGEVHACAHDRQDRSARVLDRRGEEERGLVRDHRIRRIAHVRRPFECGEEVLTERDARPLIGLHGGGDDRSLRVDDRDGLVFRCARRSGSEGVPRDRAIQLIGEVLRVPHDVRDLADEDDVAKSARKVGVDRVRGRCGPLADVGDAERGEVIARSLNADDADERDRRDADNEQRGEDLLPETNPRPTHRAAPLPHAAPLCPPTHAARCIVG